MGFITKCVIRKNTPELQKKLEEMGYDICPCVNFKNAVWLTNYLERGEIHSIGYSDETTSMTEEETLALFLYETDAIDCGDNENLFLALAAMRDDTDEGQLFLNNLGDWATYYGSGTDYKGVPGFEYYTIPYSIDPTMLHKATAEEIIKHFSNE